MQRADAGADRLIDPNDAVKVDPAVRLRLGTGGLPGVVEDGPRPTGKHSLLPVRLVAVAGALEGLALEAAELARRTLAGAGRGHVP